MTIRHKPARVNRSTWAFDIEKTLSRLTLAEKVSLTSGSDFWHTTAIPRLGIPSLRCSDGPNAACGAAFFNGTPTAVLPCGIALGATFDASLVQECGGLIADECRAKGVHFILGPSMNMPRAPIAGRGFESFSEDPWLSGVLSGYYCKGVRDGGGIATPKHLVGYDQEQDPWSIDVLVTQRALREIYLKPFMLAVKFGDPGMLMTAFNKVNGVHCSENPFLLEKVLRQEWGFRGTVISDWFGTYSVSEAISAGLDLEMPGPSRFRGQALVHAVTANKIPESDVDARVRSMLRLINEAGISGIPENAPEKLLNRPADKALLRRAANDCIVLLKNEDRCLPLEKSKSIAVIGPNARDSAYRGGKSAHLRPYYAISPLEGIAAQCTREVTFSQGIYNYKGLPLLGDLMKNARGEMGFDVRVFNEPYGTLHRKCLDHFEMEISNGFFMHYQNPHRNPDIWYIDISGTITPEKTAVFDIGLTVQGTASLYLDGELLIDNTTDQEPGDSFFHTGTTEKRAMVTLEGGRKYSILCLYGSPKTSSLEQTQNSPFTPGGITLSGCPRIDVDAAIAEAVDVALKADQVVLCVGLTGAWESERDDRQYLDLPPRTDELVAKILAVQPNTIVCLQSGSPVSMPWLSKVKGLFQAWYGGSECGNSIADVLFGKVNPSGKLPITFPRRLQDNPAYFNHRSERNRVLYGEDVYVGYRYYDLVDKDVLFPFGFGLSYTTFAVSDVSVKLDSDYSNIHVECVVTNTGSCAGAEVVQVYVAQNSPSIGRPIKELKGFEKVWLEKGKRRRVSVNMELKYATSFWDEAKDAWICEKGSYDILVGRNSRDSFQTASFKLEETFWWKGL